MAYEGGCSQPFDLCSFLSFWSLSMATGNTVRLLDIWVGVGDPRQMKKVEHKRVELLTIAVCAVLSGANTLVEIEAWANEKEAWLRQHLTLEYGIPSHDTSILTT
jgi:hypothetical protein